ncbi:hypothetical protein [Paraburkholderia sp. BCC1884]|jgi:hypothetical protein|uniref:hypothetical protein n=1 Tax=Paraburkholderia sp. BCC1884 TaxID=2562668 RepID=UPI0011825DD6|nr:hypothetical protein [Paraburkholderia sp. BCC1884]
MDALLSLLLGNRSAEEVVANISQRIHDDSARGRGKVTEVIQGRGFVYGRVSPVDERDSKLYGKID